MNNEEEMEEYEYVEVIEDIFDQIFCGDAMIEIGDNLPIPDMSDIESVVPGSDECIYVRFISKPNVVFIGSYINENKLFSRR